MRHDLARSKQMVLGEALDRWSFKTPDREAIIFQDRRVSFQDFNNRVNRLANGLSGLGIQRGDRVGFILKNCMEYAECVSEIGCSRHRVCA